MKKIKIGVVEDELIIAHDICAVLAETGYECLEPCADYEEAVDMVTRHQPDLMLLDIMLAGPRDGIDVARYLRANTNIPLIFLTANSDKATVARAKETLPDAYLVKPFHKASLYSAIEVAIFAHEEKLRRTTQVIPQAALVPNAIFVRSGEHFQKILYDEIIFLSTSQNYVTIHTKTKKFTIRAAMHDYLLQLEPSIIVRVHRSYAVNIHMVEQVHAADIIVRGSKIPVSKAYANNLLRMLNIG